MRIFLAWFAIITSAPGLEFDLIPEDGIAADLRDVTWTGSRFLACGGGTLLESATGENWQEIGLSPLTGFDNEGWHSLTQQGSRTLLTSNHQVVTSIDLLTWQSGTLPVNEVFEEVASDGSRFVALTASKKLFTSTNGLAWQLLGTLPSTSAHSLTFGNGVWMSLDSNTFYRSTDGVTWTSYDIESAINDEIEFDRYYHGGEFLIFNGTQFVSGWVEDTYDYVFTSVSSLDGLTWSTGDTIDFPIDYESQTESGGGGGFCLGCSSSVGDGYLHFGPNGIVTVYNDFLTLGEEFTEEVGLTFFAAASNTTTTVVVGSQGYRASLDSNGEWKDRSGVLTLIDAASDEQTALAAVSAFDRRLGYEGECSFLSSSDGLSWNPVTLTGNPTLFYPTIRFLNSLWHIQQDDELWTSSNLTAWTPTTLPLIGEEMQPPRPRYWLNNRYLSVEIGGFEFGSDSGGGGVSTSSDGATWAPQEPDLGDSSSSAFGAGKVATLSSQYFHSTVDGINWTQTAVTGLPDSPGQLVWFRGRWIAVSSNDFEAQFPFTLSVSEDGQSWLQMPNSDSLPSPDLAYATPVEGYLLSRSVEIYDYQFDSIFPPLPLISTNGFDWDFLPLEPEGSFFFLENPPTEFLRIDDKVLVLNQRFQKSIATLPETAPSAFQIIKPGFLEAPSQPNLQYRLQRSSTLGFGSFQTLGDWKSGSQPGEILFWMDTEAASNPKQFYRLEFQP